MKAKAIFLVLFAMVANMANAQSDYSNYLDESLSEISKGNCEGAQKLYNVYKEMSGSEKPSVQILIDDCNKKNDENRLYKINDKIEKEGKIYKVAHIEDKGRHGFAICDMGGGSITNDMITNRQLPTRSELKIILRNRRKINVTSGKYWTMDQSESGHYFYWDNGWSDWFSGSQSDSHGILLMYRF